MTPLIELSAVSRTYRTGVPLTALKGATVMIARAETVAVVGPSGSGKSTMLGLLGCLDTPTGGRVLVNGRDVAQMSDRERSLLRQKTIGFVFQQFHLIPYITALANVATALLYRGLSPKARADAAAAALRLVGLEGRAHHRPGELSGGEQQRVAIARAIAGRPQLVLADEPTGNLDSANAAVVLDLLLSLVRTLGTTLVLVTHDGAVARRVPRRISLLDGRIVADDRS